MKKLFAMIPLCALTALLIPSAHAQSPELASVYVAPGAEIVTDEAGNTETAVDVLYLYRDGTYKQELVRAGEGDPATRAPAEDGGPGAPGYVRIYPPEGETPPRPEPIPYIVNGEAYIDEGADTQIEITGYTAYGEDPASYFLSQGDKVAVISPSALPGREQTDTVIEGLRSWGFVPVEGRYVCPETRTLEESLEDLRWALEDPEIRAIFCVRGGYGATELMDALSLELIAGAGKPIIGYSDITACHGAWTMAGLPSLHACMSGAFAEDFPAACAEAERRMMQGEIPAYRCEADAYCREGTAEGVLIGGNLCTFTAALNTAYDCARLDQPYILFLEEVGENMQHIHRYLTILKHAGVLDRAAGLVFGEWTELPADGKGNYGEARGGLFASVSDMICRQFLDDADVPVAFGFPAGHGDVNYPLLMGARAKLDVGADSYTLSWEAPAVTAQAEEEGDTP